MATSNEPMLADENSFSLKAKNNQQRKSSLFACTWFE
jgi:hypothetical protein